MNCVNCGAQIEDNASFCTYCGTSIENPGVNPNPNQEFDPSLYADVLDKPNVGLIILSILFPIVGVILGIVKLNKKMPKSGKAYLIAGIIAWVINIVIMIIL